LNELLGPLAWTFKPIVAVTTEFGLARRPALSGTDGRTAAMGAHKHGLLYELSKDETKREEEDGPNQEKNMPHKNCYAARDHGSKKSDLYFDQVSIPGE